MVSKEDIKKAAFKLFAENGYEDTTTQAIAEAVGLKKQSLYSHYKSKRDIYEEILRDQSVYFSTAIKSALDRLKEEPAEIFMKELSRTFIQLFSPRERLLLWKRTLIHWGTNKGREFFETDNAQFGERLKNDIRELYDLFGGKYKRLKDWNNFKAVMLSFMLFVNGYLDWVVVAGHNDSIWRAVWEKYWNGIKYSFLQD
jgi:AcrR family transcriptional regulator